MNKYTVILSIISFLSLIAQPAYSGQKENTTNKTADVAIQEQKSLADNQANNAINSEKEFFTTEQEKYLAQHPHVYAYFSQLYTGHKKTPEQIAKEHQLRPETTQKYLQALAKIGIIEMPKDNLAAPIHFLVSGISSFSAWGPLSIKLTQDMLKQHYQKSLSLLQKGYQDQIARNDLKLNCAGIWLTSAEYKQYEKEIEALRQKYIDISKGNINAKKSEVINVSIMHNSILNWEPELFNNIKKDF